MREIFARADEKFVKEQHSGHNQNNPLRIYKFRSSEFLRIEKGFDKNALPIVFKVSPDSLLNLCIKLIDALPLPSVYKWTTLEVCKWIRQYGYPQYMNTFHVNLITGQKLLLLDAQALSAMNIKNFADIKHIAYGIRGLFFYEMTKYIRSISLPPEYYYELYKLFETKSGRKYQDVRRSDLWRRMQLLRENSPNYSHWDLLERWLARKCEHTELFGGVKRYRLYKCLPEKPAQSEQILPANPCYCMPPCSCFWTEDRHLQAPTVFSLLAPVRKADPTVTKERCRNCAPPCTCHWPSHFYKFDIILSCLRENLPNKYGEREVARRRQSRTLFTSSFLD
uniref:Sterile alpha motif domain-containing protein 15 n=1 Tax=Bactrocera dorsalis TaxID=27457 RepID=A0A034WVE8_BACDO